MFTFVFRVLAALLILCGSADAADQTVLQTSSLTDISGITAYGNTLVLGASRLSTADSGEEATGAVYITYYDDSSADYNLLSSGGLSETKLLNPYKAGQFGNPRADANGHGGFGYSIAMSGATELFISAASATSNTGRVYYYRGRHTQWSVQQTLSPHSSTEIGTFVDTDSFFGGDIATTSSTLVVGCQNCNNSDPLNMTHSGEVYVYSPSHTRGFWSEIQILTAENVEFLGENVAIHGDIVVATARSAFTVKPIYAAIFQRAQGNDRENGNGFSQQQILTVENSETFRISEVVVYDETIVISASFYSHKSNMNDIYIYYPSTSRFGYGDPGGGAQGNSTRPVQWSLHQTLNALGQTVAHNFYLQIQGNNLIYSSYDFDKDQVILYRRASLAGQWVHTAVSEVDVFEADVGISHLYTVLTPDQKLYFINLGTASALFKPVDLNPSSFHCLQIYVGDQFGDGWDTAVLTVESPWGHNDSYAPACDSYNPITYRYCPVSNASGIYKFRIEGAKDASFPWEIMWKVYNERRGEWLFGTFESEMDFEWSEQSTDFTAQRLHKLKVDTDVCPTCALTSPSLKENPKPKPKAGKPRPSDPHLRSLHGKSSTSAPTVSPAPTIDVTGLASSQQSLYLKMSNAGNDISTWFDNENSGTSYYVSDVRGTTLFSTGTACVSGLTEVSCWVELPDGDYVVRVGGALQDYVNRQWKFCGGTHYQPKQTELFFSIQFGVCTASMARSHSNVCNNVLKVSTLEVEIHLAGEFSLKQPLAPEFSEEVRSFIDSYLHTHVGEVSVSAEITSVSFHSSSTALVKVLVGMRSLTVDEVSALNEVLLSGSNQAGAILSIFDLNGMYGIKTMSINSLKFFDEIDNLRAVDESSLLPVTSFTPDSGDQRLSLKLRFMIALMDHSSIIGGVAMSLCVLFALVVGVSLYKGDAGVSSPPQLLAQEENAVDDPVFTGTGSCVSRSVSFSALDKHARDQKIQKTPNSRTLYKSNKTLKASLPSTE